MALRPRTDLHAILKGILGSDNVYFQPPPTLTLKYPCIVYDRDDVDVQHADNNPYKHQCRYQITAISTTPDNPVVEELLMLPTVEFGRSFSADYLTHDTMRIYF